jgi:hypothetical protein
MTALTKMAKQFYPYAQEYLGFDKPAQIVYQSDSGNAQNPLGKTAQYNPTNYTVTLFVDGRHPKDLLRSLAHELVHHTQNCRGDLSPEKMGEMGDGYAQTDGHLRKMEQEAYASMVMRDWEDQYKSKRRNNLHETNYINKEIYTMSEHEKLIQRIVAEVMKNVKVTTENEEDEDVKEEGQGDRKDSRDNNQQGHRQGNAADGSVGQNLEEGDDDDDAEVKEEGKYKRDDDSTSSREDAQQECAKKGKEWNTAKARCDPAKKEEGVAPDVSQHRNAGNTIDESDDEEELDEMRTQAAGHAGGKAEKHRSPKTGKKCYDAKGNQVECGSDKAVKEGKDEDDDETTDDLQETFRRRNVKLYEKLVKWSKN